MGKALLFTLCLCICQVASASGKDCGRRFRVDVNNYAPLHFVTNYNEVQGLAYEVVIELEKRTGCVFVQDPVERPRMAEDLKKWRTDFVALVSPTAAMLEVGDFIPLYRVGRKLIISSNVYDSKKKLEDYLKDPSVKFATQIGLRYFLSRLEEEKLMKAGRLISVPDPFIAYKLLLSGRIQAFFTSPVVHAHQLKNLPSFEGHYSAMADLDKKSDIGFFVSKKRINAKEQAMVREAIRGMQKDGSLEKIVNKYIAPEDQVFYEHL